MIDKTPPDSDKTYSFDVTIFHFYYKCFEMVFFIKK